MSLTQEQISYLNSLYKRVQKLTLNYNKVNQYINNILINKQKLTTFNHFMTMILTLSNESNDLFPLSEDIDKKWDIQVMLADIVLYTDDKLLIWQFVKYIILEYEVVDIHVLERNVFLKAFDDCL